MVDRLMQSLEKAFVDQRMTSSHYDPKLIVNDQQKKAYMLNALHDELDTCESFFFSVALSLIHI